MQETELKLELSQSGARSLLKKNPFGSPPTILPQRSVYFDTTGWDLSKARPIASHSAIGK
ncbi:MULTISPECIES: CYTH domain-containing protein [unclassified Mesorhizobium]|uniref:CYTH domain-containing protein n=1 Tax=unclassified Mesorhizobium TaxID=325217 RepID=UPI0024786F17|nr:MULTISPECIES: CYTH domain-containing protein [unclassified Mesorhizobium]